MQLEQFLVSPDTTVRASIDRLNQFATQILLVVNDDRQLLGTMTDGDVRRAILKRVNDETPVSAIMQPKPLTATKDWAPQKALSLMRVLRIHHIPVVDENGRVTGIFTEESLISQDELPNVAVLMVGGLGKRLGAMTSNCPKPMLNIGGKPILQTTVETLRDAGFRQFVFAVNYLAEKIEGHFGDGSAYGVSINYFQESEPLGTAGALRHIEISNNEPILVMNGDILTRVNFGHLLKYHYQNHAAATMCVREFNHEIPFGVVELDGHEISEIREKPTSSVFVNSGIYILNPESLDEIPAAGSFDMPSLFSLLREKQMATIAYPIQEYWADIGQPTDFAKAESEYASNFDQNAAGNSRK